MARFISQENRREEGDKMYASDGENYETYKIPKAGLRDTVLVEGYGGREYKVVSVEHEIDYDDKDGGEYEEISYGLLCEGDASYIIAFDEDVTLLRKDGDTAPMRAAQRYDLIDGLLEELSDVMALEELFGKLGNDDGDTTYAVRIEEIKDELRRLMEVNRYSSI